MSFYKGPIIIAHRGLMYGPNKLLENRENTIIEALENGFDVEVDVWYENNNFYLGHDKPEHLTKLSFLHSICKNAWFHAKNIVTFNRLLVFDKSFNSFFHNVDDCTLTTKGYIWTYPGKELTDNSIAVLPELMPESYDITNALGICTDYTFKFKENLNFRPKTK